MSNHVAHLFRLGIDSQDASTFHEAGVYNLTTSHENEAGTLAMFSSQIKGTDDYIVFEIYQDEEAYQIHRQSPQFKHYVENAGSKLVSRHAFEVTPAFLQEKLPSGQWIGSEHFFPKFAQVTVKADGQSAFEESVLKNMTTSLDQEAGVLAMYALKDVDNPSVWYFYEVYASEAAYAEHRDTAHFMTYIAETKDLLLDKVLLDLTNDVMVTKGELKNK